MLRRSFVLALAVVLSSCQGLPSRGADVEGRVSNVVSPGDGTGALLVEWVPTEPRRGLYARALVLITGNTKLYRENAGDLQAIQFREVLGGENWRARAWFRGPVTRSEPPQAEAEVVVVWVVAP